MLIVRIALLGSLIGSSLYSSAPAQKKEDPIFGGPTSIAWHDKFSFINEWGIRQAHGAQSQSALYYAAVLSQNDLHLEMIREKNKIAQQQLQATHEQNALIAALLAKLSISSPQATSATVTPSAPPASPKVGAARAANQMPPDYKSAAK